MLSFELSAIDLILAIAVMVLLVLYLTRLSTKPTPDQNEREHKQRPSYHKVDSEEKIAEEVVTVQKEAEKSESLRSLKKVRNCPHHFGYLQNHAPNTSVPDECLNCLKVVECILPKE